MSIEVKNTCPFCGTQHFSDTVKCACGYYFDREEYEKKVDEEDVVAYKQNSISVKAILWVIFFTIVCSLLEYLWLICMDNIEQMGLTQNNDQSGIFEYQTTTVTNLNRLLLLMMASVSLSYAVYSGVSRQSVFGIKHKKIRRKISVIMVILFNLGLLFVGLNFIPSQTTVVIDRKNDFLKLSKRYVIRARSLSSWQIDDIARFSFHETDGSRYTWPKGEVNLICNDGTRQKIGEGSPSLYSYFAWMLASECGKELIKE